MSVQEALIISAESSIIRVLSVHKALISAHRATSWVDGIVLDLKQEPQESTLTHEVVVAEASVIDVFIDIEATLSFINHSSKIFGKLKSLLVQPSIVIH